MSCENDNPVLLVAHEHVPHSSSSCDIETRSGLIQQYKLAAVTYESQANLKLALIAT